MAPNKGRNWTDVELIISSVSVALTLGFWGLFASRQKVGADVVGQVSLVPGAGNAVTATAPPTVLVPGQTIFFGVTTPQAPAPLASQPKPRRRGDGGGGGGGGGAVASTKSS